MAGKNVKLTPNGLLVIVRQRRISARNASGVGCVKAVSIPKAPALETAEAISAVPTYCIPPLERFSKVCYFYQSFKGFYLVR